MHIYELPITNIEWSQYDDCLLHFISPTRKNKLLRYRFATERKLCLYSGLLARMALSKLSNIPAEYLEFGVSSYHKPFLLNTPQYQFNFSHTKNFIVCGISLLDSVGVDVEKNQKAPIYIMKNLFHPFEIDFVNNSSNPDIDFFKIWTRKESYAKYTSIGISEDLKYINTLDSKYTSYFFTWHNADYICSFYSLDSESTTFNRCTENLIQSFFLS